MTERDPSVDQPLELYPDTQHVEDRSDVLVTVETSSGRRTEQAVGANVDDDGVAHFLLMTPDPSVPDICGGCQREWPCPKRVAVQMLERPPVDPALVAAVAAALRQERDSGLRA